MDRENFPSFIPAEKVIPELTLKAILVGIFLAVVLGAANAYLGLYAGMTVSAIIPGAVMALAMMKPFKPTILEINIATMGASAGECIAAGVIFTIPALILLNVWTEINYLQTTLISLIGGVLGVLMDGPAPTGPCRKDGSSISRGYCGRCSPYDNGRGTKKGEENTDDQRDLACRGCINRCSLQVRTTLPEPLP